MGLHSFSFFFCVEHWAVSGARILSCARCRTTASPTWRSRPSTYRPRATSRRRRHRSRTSSTTFPARAGPASWTRIRIKYASQKKIQNSTQPNIALDHFHSYFHLLYFHLVGSTYLGQFVGGSSVLDGNWKSGSGSSKNGSASFGYFWFNIQGNASNK